LDTVPPDGTLYVADTANRAIRKITPGGVVTTLVTTASLAAPAGLDISANGGTLFVADAGAHVIRAIALPGGAATLVAGVTGSAGCSEGSAGQTRLDSPADLVVADSGNLYVADTGNSRILEITPGGVTRTLAGSPAGEPGFIDANGTAARFDRPRGLILDASGTLHVADTGNSVLRRISPADEATTLLLSQTTPPGGENNNGGNDNGGETNNGGSGGGGGGGGGGGAPGAWFFFACAVITIVRLCKKFRGASHGCNRK
jgi:sugar lactone lactonase YvrE